MEAEHSRPRFSSCYATHGSSSHSHSNELKPVAMEIHLASHSSRQQICASLMFYVQKLPGIAEKLFPSPPISAGKACLSVLFSLDICPLHFWDFLKEYICTDDAKATKELKDAIVSEFGHLHSQIVENAITYPRTIHLPAMALA